MTAQDYPVYFPYGATSTPYSPTHPHRGDDLACSMGTPISIGGQIIGLTGNTGSYQGVGYAPHLHIQEWSGNKATTRKPQNAFKSGVVVEANNDPSFGDGSLGKFITIKTDDGWNDSYCHLSRIDVKVGDVIGDEMLTDDYTELIFVAALHKHATQADLNAWRGLPPRKLIDELYHTQEWSNQDSELKNPSGFEAIPYQVFKKKG